MYVCMYVFSMYVCMYVCTVKVSFDNHMIIFELHLVRIYYIFTCVCMYVCMYVCIVVTVPTPMFAIPRHCHSDLHLGANHLPVRP